MAFVTVIGALALFSWLGVIGAIALVVAQSARGERPKAFLVVVSIVVALLLNVVSNGLFFVEPFERGVVVTIASGGVREEPLDAGLHWVIPFAENVITYPVQNQTYTMSIAPTEGAIAGDDSIQGRTSDGQVVIVDASVIFSLNPARVVDIHTDWRGAYVDGLIRPLARGVIRDAVAQFAIEEVYSSKREDMKLIIESQLREKLEEEGLILNSFVLRNIAFSNEYAAAIEQKQIAEQIVQQAQFVVQQREQEAQQSIKLAEGEKAARILRAEGEAQALVIQATAGAEARLIRAEAESEALLLLGEAIAANPNVLLLEYIQKLADNITVMLLPSDNPFLLPLPELDRASPGGFAPQ